MKSSSKGASEKIRLTQYVTNTVLDDNYKGTTEQFVPHFNEQFKKLEEISEESEHFPPQIKLQLLQNAARPINDLRIVETLDEFQPITTGYGRSSSLKYQTYLLKNSSSLFSMISCLERTQNFLGSCVAFLKTTCLHVSFAAHENFYKLYRNTVSS